MESKAIKTAVIDHDVLRGAAVIAKAGERRAKREGVSRFDLGKVSVFIHEDEESYRVEAIDGRCGIRIESDFKIGGTKWSPADDGEGETGQPQFSTPIILTASEIASLKGRKGEPVRFWHSREHGAWIIDRNGSRLMANHPERNWPNFDAILPQGEPRPEFKAGVKTDVSVLIFKALELAAGPDAIFRMIQCHENGAIRLDGDTGVRDGAKITAAWMPCLLKK